VTPWEHVEERIGAHRRRASYSLNRQISQFGTKVTCIQQQTVSDDLKKLVTNEILTLHDVPFGEYFEVFVLIASHVGFFIKDKKVVQMSWHTCRSYPLIDQRIIILKQFYSRRSCLIS
jgi:hypothetical protein